MGWRNVLERCSVHSQSWLLLHTPEILWERSSFGIRECWDGLGWERPYSSSHSCHSHWPRLLQALPGLASGCLWEHWESPWIHDREFHPTVTSQKIFLQDIPMDFPGSYPRRNSRYPQAKHFVLLSNLISNLWGFLIILFPHPPLLPFPYKNYS